MRVMGTKFKFYPVENPLADCYRVSFAFEVDDWATMAFGAEFATFAKTVNKPLDIPTSGGLRERLLPLVGGEVLRRDEIDSSCTWLIQAGDLKNMEFHHPDFSREKVIRSKAMSAYFDALPDDWPVIVFYV